MREIKFRGKAVETNEWVYGSLIQCEVSGKEYIFPKGNDANESERVGEDGCLSIFTHEIYPETLGQYTGIKDKNDKEIYEGDIVSFEDAECDAEGYHDNVFLNRGVVSYDEVSMCYSFSNRQTVDMEDLYIPTDAEIIGNIYENPELL